VLNHKTATFDELLAAIAAAPVVWRITCGTLVRDVDGLCPIARVCGLKWNGDVYMEIPSPGTKRIARAADDDTSSPADRTTLLAACKLVEPLC
jgi:hypothetical protein